MSEVEFTPQEQLELGSANLFGNPAMAAGIIQRAVVRTAINTEAGAKAASFSVDIEQIPGLIAKYEEAQRELYSTLDDAQELQLIAEHGAPGNDEVSKNLASSLGNMAGHEPFKLAWAVQQGIDRLQGQIDQLQKALAEYKAADEAATPNQA